VDEEGSMISKLKNAAIILQNKTSDKISQKEALKDITEVLSVSKNLFLTVDLKFSQNTVVFCL
jgi:hypothetical protein